MIRFTTSRLGLAVLALLGATVLGQAQIERLTLNQMIERTDNAVVGEIIKREVIRIDHETDGPELYYTHLTIEGKSLINGAPLTAKVTYPGGFTDKENGVWNSEAPSDADTVIGKNVVAFYKWSDNMGGDLAANALYASHGGLYTTAKGRAGTIVLGKGVGYAVENNVKLSSLDAEITAIKSQQK